MPIYALPETQAVLTLIATGQTQSRSNQSDQRKRENKHQTRTSEKSDTNVVVPEGDVR